MFRPASPHLPPRRWPQVSTTVLQRGASYGLSLAEIGNIMSRPLGTLDEEPSEMEVLCYRAMTMAREETAGPERPLGASRQADEPQVIVGHVCQSVVVAFIGSTAHLWKRTRQTKRMPIVNDRSRLVYRTFGV